MTKINKAPKKILLTALIIFIIFIIWVLWGNTALELNTYKITSKNIPAEFNVFRIAQVSDLHNTEIESDNQKLIELLRESEPNIIVITGDIVDSRKTDIDIALKFAAEAIKIAPCYYVTGNHEARIKEYSDLKNSL